jgi:hypothetical protein
MNTRIGLDNHCNLYKSIKSTDIYLGYNEGKPYSSSEEYNNLDVF